MKTHFEFCSTAFNCTEIKNENEWCLGDDVAEWLIDRLKSQGIQTAERPGQEDFGWYFTFHIDGVEHCVVLGFRPNDRANGGQWLGWIERHRGFIGSMFGGRNRGISPQAIVAIDSALNSSSEIRNLVWTE